MMNVISIDFDETLYNNKTMLPMNIDKVNKLFEDPLNFIVIYTSRSYSCFEDIRQILRIAGCKFNALVCEKMRADVYVDDKNVGGLKWS
jgi:hydroxymethylpyrimidine pyrophosphatase-like HAD family hydrolase